MRSSARMLWNISATISIVAFSAGGRGLFLELAGAPPQVDRDLLHGGVVVDDIASARRRAAAPAVRLRPGSPAATRPRPVPAMDGVGGLPSKPATRSRQQPLQLAKHAGRAHPGARQRRAGSHQAGFVGHAAGARAGRPRVRRRPAQPPRTALTRRPTAPVAASRTAAGHRRRPPPPACRSSSRAMEPPPPPAASGASGLALGPHRRRLPAAGRGRAALDPRAQVDVAHDALGRPGIRWSAGRPRAHAPDMLRWTTSWTRAQASRDSPALPHCSTSSCDNASGRSTSAVGELIAALEVLHPQPQVVELPGGFFLDRQGQARRKDLALDHLVADQLQARATPAGRAWPLAAAAQRLAPGPGGRLRPARRPCGRSPSSHRGAPASRASWRWLSISSDKRLRIAWTIGGEAGLAHAPRTARAPGARSALWRSGGSWGALTSVASDRGARVRVVRDPRPCGPRT